MQNWEPTFKTHADKRFMFRICRECLQIHKKKAYQQKTAKNCIDILQKRKHERSIDVRKDSLLHLKSEKCKLKPQDTISHPPAILKFSSLTESSIIKM